MDGQVLADVHPTNSLHEPQAGVPAVVPDESVPDELVQDELLIEEISIDGMCGVY